jgi:hypothetical protein
LRHIGERLLPTSGRHRELNPQIAATDSGL